MFEKGLKLVLNSRRAAIFSAKRGYCAIPYRCRDFYSVDTKISVYIDFHNCKR